MKESERTTSRAKEPPATAPGLGSARLGEPEPLDGPVLLVPYDSDWPARFERVAGRIRTALGGRALLLEQVGSTAVPGPAAKPVIDVLLAVADAADEPSYLPALERVGFVLRIREPAWFEHRLLDARSTRANVHLLGAGCEEIGWTLAFRDRLRADEDDRAPCERTKRELAARSWRTMQDYADAKTDVVRRILASRGRPSADAGPPTGETRRRAE